MPLVTDDARRAVVCVGDRETFPRRGKEADRKLSDKAGGRRVPVLRHIIETFACKTKRFIGKLKYLVTYCAPRRRHTLAFMHLSRSALLMRPSEIPCFIRLRVERFYATPFSVTENRALNAR